MFVLQEHSVLFQLGYLILVPQLSHIFRSFFINCFGKFCFLISFPSFASGGDGTGTSLCERKMFPRVLPKENSLSKRRCTTGGGEADPALYGIVSCKDDFARTESPGVHRCHHVGRT